ncbi:tetratricopeptide repeat protein [Bifidobacterium sp. LC6]|uniref:Tetratricopeptide repeat protein n=1 Tax=Bifidobacterium colobi TaxID=2809026 RepID=A0ABS5UW45_9BIFI|nr:tetratricopeptide repeat protein [Bifidobacterium colobi]MBT1174926.1 tetratricopeptide repeat protein [Bifidobacterium colobi]
MSSPRNHRHPSLLGEFRDSVNALAADLGLIKPKKADSNPFGDALREPSERSGGIIDELTRHAVTLSPVAKRHTFPALENVPEGLVLGWAQLPSTRGRGFSLGIFPDKNHFAQVAFADTHGRVFVGSDPDMDVQEMQPRFMFGKEKDVTLPNGERLGLDELSSADRARVRSLEQALRLRAGMPVNVVSGGIVGRDDTGRMTWLASWLKTGNRYTLEQMRANLPASMRHDLEYRDAIAIAFFAAYMLPQVNGLLIGFGSGNIFRRLNREAPIGAIRRAVRDTLAARAHGMRASGLEDHFADLMREAGALDKLPGLEAVHGAEALHLYTSTYSNSYFFAWDTSLAFSQALRALKIEGNLNRFAAVSAWLERNSSLGRTPTEDTVTRAEAAQIDMRLIENPAIMALEPYDGADEQQAVLQLVKIAERTASQIQDGFPNPRLHDAHENSHEHDQAHAAPDAQQPGEWVYRQTLSTLLRRLRLPYRFDVEFRSCLERGEVAIGFTTAGTSMMPNSRYDDVNHTWRTLSSTERAAMSVAYNLRVGLMMAAMSFGASPQVNQVSLHIDSIGLEEAIAEQDSAIEQMMSEALRAFEHLRSGDLGRSSSKADPKDGDFHGDPTRPITHDETFGQQAAADAADGTEGAHGQEAGAGDQSDDASIDSQFEDLMKGMDIDEMSFSLGPQSDGGGTDADDNADAQSDAGGDDPMSVLRRNPTVRNMVTVTLSRDAFLQRLHTDGLKHPQATYRMFGAVMDVDGEGGLKPINADFDLTDRRFSPNGSQEEPELADREFDAATARVLGAKNSSGLAIQRVDMLQRAVNEFHTLAHDSQLDSVEKAQQAMSIIDAISDPELNDLASQVTSALIDGNDTPDFKFTLADGLDKERLRARDLLFSGQADQAIDAAEAAVAHLDQIFAAGPGVPRYFNSYAERVVYNRLFATMDERTLLIPDNLFYAHMELADVLGQIKGAKAAIPHLNRMVAYAPAYPLSHLKLAIQLARNEDWDSARAACLNALRVALDRDDAAFAYYRFAYCEWMLDHFETAAAAYIMSDHIAPGAIASLEGELQELVARADSQCIHVPESVDSAAYVLASHDLPVWPNIEVGAIVRDAARVCVDEGMFVPARTLSVAVARMDDGEGGDIDIIQAQYLRSLTT